MVSCTVLKAIWQKSSFGWRLTAFRFGFCFGSGFFGMNRVWHGSILSARAKDFKLYHYRA
jgi:hypothetical protein